MENLVAWLWREEEGQDLTEYALLMSLVTMIAILSIKVLGRAVSNLFSNSASNIVSS
jgi:Flp pilus assembly pilin Flp